MKNRLLIRADASAAIGTGHVMRCLALAQAWSARGGTVSLVAAQLVSGIEKRVAGMGVAIRMIQVAAGSEEDADATVEIAREIGADWIVADGYALGEIWQGRVKGAGFALLVCDDYGHLGRYQADLIVNQNSGAHPGLYRKRSPECRLLLGSKYVLLRSEFCSSRRGDRNDRPTARRVLVTLGGGDPDNVTALVIRAALQVAELEFKVVIGAANPNRAALLQQCDDTANVEAIVDPANMPELMAWADVAIAAGGSTCWELAKLGLPALITVIAENQSEIAADLYRRGICENLGDFRALTVERIADALRALVSDGDRRRAMSERGRTLVDGHGASRVAAALGARLNVAIVSDRDSWLNPTLAEMKCAIEAEGHRVAWVHDPSEIPAGDVAFLLSLSRIVPQDILARNAHNLVVHESALPRGRGWSPLTWQVIEGKTEIPVTLFEAAEGVDSGDIYADRTLRFRGDELVAELRTAQAAATAELCRDFVAGYPFILGNARPQRGEPSHYPRRRPADSRLDPDKTLREQFNLLRVCDPERYPAYFELAGRRYELRVSAGTS